VPVLSTEVKVGLFVAVGIAVLAYMTIRLGDFKFGEEKGYEIWAVFDHATGLKKGAPVEMAGIQIGKVERISLYENRARVSMRVANAVSLPIDSSAFIRTRGVLGDKYISVEAGSQGAPKLKNGQELTKAQVPTDLDEVMSKIGSIASDVKDLTSSLRVSIGSPESQRNISESLANIKEITGALKDVVADNQMRLRNVIVNLEKFSQDMSQLSGQNKQALAETIQNFRAVSGQLDRTIYALTSVAEKIDNGQGTIGALVNDRQTIDNLNKTLASLKDISQKIDEGKGTLGKLVNDDTTVTKIDEALTGINDYITRADAWRTYIDYRGEYLTRDSALRSTLNVRLQPKADKFYILGITTDPIGRRTEKESIVTHQQGGATWTERTKTVTIDKDALKWNAQIGKRFYDVSLRAGLFESTGGIGFDYHMLDDDLKFTVEAYDFRQDENPRLKISADFHFWKYFYVTAGYFDPLSEYDHDQFMIGGGVRFYDDDLKFLLTSAPTP
jgi:phospholipid/cholesterol/gamma-HCH transport system substrate-binding protein